MLDCGTLNRYKTRTVGSVKIVGTKTRPRNFLVGKWSETRRYGILLIYFLVPTAGDLRPLGVALSHTVLCMPYVAGVTMCKWLMAVT